MKRALSPLVLIFALCAFNQTARAQEFVYGFTGIGQSGYQETGGVMFGYSATGATYGIALWYNVIHLSTLQRDGVTVDQVIVEGYPEVANFTVATIQTGSVYQQFSDHILRIVSIYFCGIPFDAYGFSYWVYSGHGEVDTWPPFPSICIAYTLLYLGYTVAQAQAQGQATCTDTCTPCQTDRQNRIITCTTVATACELAAFGAYNSAMGSCNNQAYCNPENPSYNAQQCAECKNTARENLFIATAACGGTAVGCFLTLPDCGTKNTCPSGPTGPPGPCN